jgi:DNA-binding PadR family transcriptional regulator
VGATVRMRSAVNWAVLGLVIERPSYGYELFQRLGRRYDGVLEPPISQIYAALDGLERALLIEPLQQDEAAQLEDEAGSRRSARRQPKVHYRATPKGARAFRSWLAEQLREDPVHGELLRRLAATGGAGLRRPEILHELIDDYERACVEEASRLPLRNRESAPAGTAQELVERLVLGGRRALLDAQHEWIAYARRELQAFNDASAGRERGDGPAGA